MFCIADDEHVLVIVVIGGHRMSVLVTTFAADQNFAMRLVLELLLVNTLGPNDESDVVNALEFGQEDLAAECHSRRRVLKVAGGYARD